MSEDLPGTQVDVDAVIEVALRAADLVTEMRAQGLRSVRSKSSTIDIVTEADIASEKLIRRELSALDGTVGFWGEESNEQPQEPSFWIVDPIDGTNNFAMGIPHYAVNIALQDSIQTLLGVTIALPARRVYWAVAGEGAFLREPDGSEQPLRVNSAQELGGVFLTTGFPYHRAEHADNNSAEHTHFLTKAQGVRCLGASALDLVYVASGAFGGYWEAWIKPWDAAPGVLMIREAGGKVTKYGGEEWSLHDQTLIASNGQPRIHQALVDGIRAARSTLREPLL